MVFNPVHFQVIGMRSPAAQATSAVDMLRIEAGKKLMCMYLITEIQ
jgi:hypothetical protein